MTILIRNDDVEWKEITDGRQAFSKDLVTTDQWSAMSVHHVRVEPGGSITAHGHRIEKEAHFVISGRGIASLGDNDISIGPGDVLLAEPEISHGIINPGSEPLILLCVFTPPLS